MREGGEGGRSREREVKREVRRDVMREVMRENENLAPDSPSLDRTTSWNACDARESHTMHITALSSRLSALSERALEN